MEFKTTRSKRAAGFVLVDLMVGVAISAVVLAALMSLTLTSARSFASMGNYSEMSADSRAALDLMSKLIRNSVGVQSCTGESITLFDAQTNQFSIEFDADAKTVTLYSDSESRLLLEDCDSISWGIFQRTPKAGTYEAYPASRPELAKLVQVNWTCSRTLLGKKMHTESVQSSKIVIRNNER
jgi:Tfp pilus assembly protein PilW